MQFLLGCINFICYWFYLVDDVFFGIGYNVQLLKVGFFVCVVLVFYIGWVLYYIFFVEGFVGLFFDLVVVYFIGDDEDLFGWMGMLVVFCVWFKIYIFYQGGVSRVYGYQFIVVGIVGEEFSWAFLFFWENGIQCIGRFRFVCWLCIGNEQESGEVKK